MAAAKKPKPKKAKPAAKKKPAKRAPYDPKTERATLAKLEQRLAAATEPAELSAVAREAATLSTDIAMTIYRLVMKPGPDSEVHALVDLMNRASATSVAASQQAARRHVELGSPKRAVHALFECFRVAQADSLPAATEQLATLLDTHAPARAGELRKLLATFVKAWANAKKRENAKMNFLQGTQAVSSALDWNSLPDAG